MYSVHGNCTPYKYCSEGTFWLPKCFLRIWKQKMLLGKGAGKEGSQTQICFLMALIFCFSLVHV